MTNEELAKQVADAIAEARFTEEGRALQWADIVAAKYAEPMAELVRLKAVVRERCPDELPCMFFDGHGDCNGVGCPPCEARKAMREATQENKV